MWLKWADRIYFLKIFPPGEGGDTPELRLMLWLMTGTHSQKFAGGPEFQVSPLQHPSISNFFNAKLFSDFVMFVFSFYIVIC